MWSGGRCFRQAGACKLLGEKDLEIRIKVELVFNKHLEKACDEPEGACCWQLLGRQPAAHRMPLLLNIKSHGENSCGERIFGA